MQNADHLIRNYFEFSFEKINRKIIRKLKNGKNILNLPAILAKAPREFR